MKILFITQKIDEQDDDLAFVAQWVDEFIKNGFAVEVLCLEQGVFDGRFPVYSLGKEKGYGKWKRILRFYKYLFSNKPDRVFVHMNPEYFTLGGWYWCIRRVPMYLWYTHYTMHIHLRLAGFFSRKMFAATKQSLPQYEGSPKKVVTGHGVDVDYWYAKNQCTNPKKIIMVHRLSRSKRVELGIQALKFLPDEYTLEIYGRAIDSQYYQELQKMVQDNGLDSRVTFNGPVPMPELRAQYPQHRIMINMASETIDKTMLEAMCNGVYPVTTAGNAVAIGLQAAPVEDTPEAIATFIRSGTATEHTPEQLPQIVRDRHSLYELVKKMGEYIKGGI